MTSRTILFIDQVGSTRLVAEIGNRSMLDIRVRLWDVIHSAVDKHNGRVFSDEGDGGAAVFLTADDAAGAAIDMLDSTRNEAIDIRIGINTGPVIANGEGLVGLAVHIAARLCDEAPRNHAVLGDSSAEAVSNAVWVTTPFGHRLVKGLDEPIDVWLLTAGPLSDSEVDRLATSPIWESLPSSRLLESRAKDLIGREQARSHIHERATATQSGSVELILVSGNPGAGKSTLVQTTALELAASGSLCLLGRADEAFDNPFNEIIEMFTHVIAEAPSALLADHVLRHGDLLTRLLPGLADRVPSASGWRDDSSDVTPDRGLLFEAVADLLRSIARHQPLVLIFEDVHWASTPTLDLVRFLLRSKDLGPVLLIVTYRPTDIAADGATADFVDLVRGDSASSEVEVAPFSIIDVEELVQLSASELATARPDLVAPFARHIHQQTGGNGLFCAEILRSLQATELVAEADLPLIDASTLISRLGPPQTVQDLARRRAERLGKHIANVLTDAAVFGESFATAELQAIHTSDADVLGALDIAERDGLVRAEDAAGRRYSFSHALVQLALYSRMAMSERLRRHRRAADVITALPEGAGRPADALHHLQSAGVLAEQRDIAGQASLAAEQARDRLALTQALTFRQIAAAASIDDPTASPSERAHIIAALGRAQTAIGLLAGKASMVQAANYARQGQNWELFAEIAADYGGDLKENQAVFAVGEPIQLIEEALERQTDPTALRARLLVSLALWKRQNTPYAERRPLVDEAVTIARSLDDPFALATVLASHHRALHGPNVSNEALANAAEIERLATRQGDDSMLFQALNVRLMVAFATGDWALAQQTQRQLHRVGESLRHIEGQRLAIMWDCVNAALRGEFEAAFAKVAECRRLLVGYPEDDLGRFVAALSFVSLWLQGESAAIYEITLQGHLRDTSLAWFAADSAQHDRVVSAVRDSGGIAAIERQMDYMWWHDVVALTRAARCLNDAEAASEIYTATLPYRSNNATMGLVSFFGAAEHHLGTLAMVIGDHEIAVEHFDAALARHRDMGARPFVALTAAELSQALEARGTDEDRSRADQLRIEATVLAAELNLGLVTSILDADPNGQ